ncbi:LuxR family transcriptional regulator [Longimycelium tulufanense]|uniref:LuxR family transcriptional regulator n=1 Tax=Longimycelium tulufanense TaxID=907463 RepID=A0A8J3C8V7_9PSEU|nr:LuxR family transcriptional regulator [Longimycelium tulufanense]GGM57037.1 LuxR family transcriptional regulator [Longimycelium tulufanense]
MTELARPALVGRAAELQMVDELISEVSAGQGRALWWEGELGIGKSALLAAIAERAFRQGWRVLVGAAEELHQNVPFGTLATCVPLAVTDCDRVTAPTAADAEAALSEVFLATIDDLCSAGPTALLIDDLHWADPASLGTLRELTHAMRQLPIFLVFATDSSALHRDAWAALREGLVGGGAVVRQLAPLDADSVQGLAGAALQARPGPRLTHLLQATGGNPLYALELLDRLTRQGEVRRDGGIAEVDDAAVSAPLTAAILERLEALRPGTRPVLEAATLLGAEYRPEDVATVARRPLDEARRALSDAVEAGLLVRHEDLLAFRHEVVRRALLEIIPETTRLTMHLDAGLTLAGTDAPAEQVAEQLALGTPTADPRVVTWLDDHAEYLTARVPDLALRLLRNAVEFGVPGDRTIEALRLRLAAALLRSGEAGETATTAQAALAHNEDPAQEGGIRWLIAQARYAALQPHLAYTEVQQALATGRLTPAETARFQALGSVALLTMGDLDGATALAHPAAEAGERLGDPIAIADACQTLAADQLVHWRITPGLDYADRALRQLGAEEITGDRLVSLQIIRANALWALGRWEEADRAARTALRLAERSNASRRQQCHLTVAFVLFVAGRWDDAEAEIQAGLGLPADWTTPHLRAMLSAIAMHRNDLRTAQRHASEMALSGSSAFGDFYGFVSLWARQLLDVAEGEPERAARRFLDLIERVDSPLVMSPMVSHGPLSVRLALSVGDEEMANRIVSAMERQLPTIPSPDPGVADLVAHCQGLVRRDVARVRQARSYYERTAWMIMRGHYHEDIASLLAQAGQVSEARQELDEALGIYASLDARWDAAQAEARLRRWGLRRGVRGRRPRERIGWESLTPTELRVAGLVSEGLSNPAIAERLFVSRRTVQTHVSNILAKLGISSRTELAAAMAVRQQ